MIGIGFFRGGFEEVLLQSVYNFVYNFFILGINYLYKSNTYTLNVIP